VVAGPFHNLDVVEICTGPSRTTNQQAPESGPNVTVVDTNGDPLVWAVDTSGNTSRPVKPFLSTPLAWGNGQHGQLGEQA